MSQWSTTQRKSFVPSVNDDIRLNGTFSATPVVLYGIIKDPPAVALLRKKLSDDDYTWPPRRSFRKLSPNLPITAIEYIKVLPATVAALKIDW